MKEYNSKIIIVICGCIAVAVGSSVFADDNFSPSPKQRSTVHRSEQDLIINSDSAKRLRNEQDILDHAREDSKKTGNILKEPHPDEVVIGPVQHPSWPQPAGK